MIVSHTPSPFPRSARAPRIAADTAPARTRPNVAARFRRALIRTELLLTIAAAPRPTAGCAR